MGYGPGCPITGIGVYSIGGNHGPVTCCGGENGALTLGGENGLLPLGGGEHGPLHYEPKSSIIIRMIIMNLHVAH